VLEIQWLQGNEVKFGYSRAAGGKDAWWR